MQIAEALGTVPKRREISSELFRRVVAAFEHYRSDVEAKLDMFDEETMSWRDYAGGFDWIDNQLWVWAKLLIGSSVPLRTITIKVEPAENRN